MHFPSIGDVFEGRYLIQSVIGSGGFARVYRAQEIGLDRDVALKVLRPPSISDQSDSQRDDYMETLMQRFRREAMLLSKLRSPYTITMYHYGTSSEGLLFMALEYIDGLSLAEVSRNQTPLSSARVVKILSQVLESLHEAHSMGMLHRDLKPANVMVYEHLGDADKVKLLDFGIAKTLGDTSRKDLTSDGTLIGTPRYMAPEQIQGDPSAVGPPADVYALGLVAFELLVGHKAVQGDNSIQIIGNQLGAASYALPDELNVPPMLRSVVNKMMEKSQSARYSSCEQILQDLRNPHLMAEDPAGATIPSGLPLMTFNMTPVSDDDLNELTDPSEEQNPPAGGLPLPLPALLVIGAALVLAVLIGLMLLSKESPEADSNDAIAMPIEVEENEESGDEEPQEADEKAETVKTLVASNTYGVEILVDGELIGTAPIEIQPEVLPAVITARIGTTEKTATLEERKPSLIIAFDQKEVAKIEAAAAKKSSKTKKTPRRTKRTNKKFDVSRKSTKDRSKFDVSGKTPTKKDDSVKYYLE